MSVCEAMTRSKLPWLNTVRIFSAICGEKVSTTERGVGLNSAASERRLEGWYSRQGTVSTRWQRSASPATSGAPSAGS